MHAQLAVLGARAQAVRCPFLRRRLVDVLEALADTLAWALAARHKSLPLPGPPPRVLGATKRTHLPLDERRAIIEEDFRGRHYYITGRLTPELYADDCLFDGPDPDVPVVGLVKYVDATSKLFYRPKSRVDLLSIQTLDGCEKVRAHWRLEGALNLPWKPAIKPYTGSTLYSFNDQGLVCSHVEEWSISAFDAFASTLLPALQFGEPPAPPANFLIERHGRLGTPFHDRL
jgi:Uncharacterized conserved protein (DUF2358)